MGHWAMQRGLVTEDMADCFNDDRIGRALDRLFNADRAALIGAVTLKAINTFGIDTSRIHNDSTSIRLFGDYADYEDDVKAAKPAYSKNSKDHRPDRIQYDARYDGIFPLITNHQNPAVEILKFYKYQPYLEKRHEQLKSVYNVAPVFLRNPQRIESLLLLYFLGMLITALIERKARSEMKERDLPSIPIYPEGRPCKSPTADKLIGLFSDVRLQYICKDRAVLQIVPDEFSKVQTLVLDLMGLRPAAFFKTG